METLRDKLLKGCYTTQRWKKLLQSLQKVEPDSTLCNDWCNLSHNDFDHCTACYTVQWSVQLVSQRFWPLHSMLHGAILLCSTIDATCLTTILTIAQHVTRCNGPCNLSRNDFDHCTACYTVQWFVQVAWKIAPCNRALSMLPLSRYKQLTQNANYKFKTNKRAHPTHALSVKPSSLLWTSLKAVFRWCVFFNVRLRTYSERVCVFWALRTYT